MSTAPEFWRWDAGCFKYPSQHLSPQDYTWGGFADYSQPYPCPNGLGISTVEVADSPAWRRRVERAKRDIETHSAEWRLRDMAAAITVEELQNDLQEIRTWANSLRKTR